MEKNEADVLEKYIESLSKKERKGYEIAKSHLGMSFQLDKSVGFIEYKKNIYNNTSIGTNGDVAKR